MSETGPAELLAPQGTGMAAFVRVARSRAERGGGEKSPPDAAGYQGPSKGPRPGRGFEWSLQPVILRDPPVPCVVRQASLTGMWEDSPKSQTVTRDLSLPQGGCFHLLLW